MHQLMELSLKFNDRASRSFLEAKCPQTQQTLMCRLKFCVQNKEAPAIKPRPFDIRLTVNGSVCGQA